MIMSVPQVNYSQNTFGNVLKVTIHGSGEAHSPVNQCHLVKARSEEDRRNYTDTIE